MLNSVLFCKVKFMHYYKLIKLLTSEHKAFAIKFHEEVHKVGLVKV